MRACGLWPAGATHENIEGYVCAELRADVKSHPGQNVAPNDYISQAASSL